MNCFPAAKTEPPNGQDRHDDDCPNQRQQEDNHTESLLSVSQKEACPLNCAIVVNDASISAWIRKQE